MPDLRNSSISRSLGKLFAFDMLDTSRQLLRHVILAALLTLRLSMIPLLYLYHKLSKGEEHPSAHIWSTLKLPPQLLGMVRDPRDTNSAKVVNTANKIISLGTRTFRHLLNVDAYPIPYNSDKIELRDRQAALVANQILIPRRSPGRSVTPRLNLEYNSIVHEDEVSPNSKEAKVRASQIYHAVLVNSETLDNVLTHLEDSESAVSEQPAVRNIRSTNEIYQQQKYSSRNSSIQHTPEEVLSPRKLFDSTSQTRSAPNLYSRQIETEAKVESSISRDVHAPVLGQRTPLQNTLKDGLYGHDICSQDLQLRLGDMTSAKSLKRCPTFVRRHDISNLPRRSIGSNRLHLGTSVITTNQSGSLPTQCTTPKRARLQRRVKGYPNKT